MTNILTKQAFVTQDSYGEMVSYEYNQIYVVGSSLASGLISAGLAVEYTGAVAKPYGTKSITSNGTADVAEYQSANVSVANTYTAGDEGKVVDSGGLVAQTSVTYTENGTYNTTKKNSVTINVGIYTITYDANGGTGSVTAQVVVAGNSAELSDGTGLTAPADKTFAGWGTTADKTEPDVESPYTPTGNVTLYAVYTATAES